MRQLSFPALLLIVSACGTAQSTLDNVDAHLGGLSFDPEQPFFGPTHRAEFDAAGESTIPQAVEGPGPVVDVTSTRWAVWSAWGHFLPTRDDPAWTNWSGSVTSDEGTLSLVRTLAFDRRDEVTPPPDDHTVAFVSHTRPHFDGLISLVTAPSSAPAPTVTLQTPPLTVPVSLTAQAQLQVLPVPGSSTLHVATIAVPIRDAAPCSTMVVTGRWRALNSNRGIQSRLVGRWFSPQGDVVGHWRAFMGHKRDGTEAFFGKVIDPQGNALALLRGSVNGDVVSVDILDAQEATLGQATLSLARAGEDRLPVVALATQQACF